MCGIGTQLGMQMCTGQEDTSQFSADSNYNHYLTVNMNKCKFSGQPIVFTSVTCTSYCRQETSLGDIITDNNVMSPTEFTLYVRTGSAESLATIRRKKWKIQ